MTEKLSSGEREEVLAELAATGWEAVPDRDAIKKTFKFRNFVDAFAWMTKMAIAAEKANHHPEWFNVYSRVEVTLTTHDAGGLSALDVNMAKAMDQALG